GAQAHRTPRAQGPAPRRTLRHLRCTRDDRVGVDGHHGRPGELARRPPLTTKLRPGMAGALVFSGHMAGTVHVIDHPLVQHKLSLMRSKDTSTSTFRNLLREISMLLAYEVCRDLPTTLIPIESPIAPLMAPILDGTDTVLGSYIHA